MEGTFMSFTREMIRLDCEKEIELLVTGMRGELRRFKRGGAVIGISGGIDSSVVAALAARAFGTEKVLGVSMPEKESSDESTPLAVDLAKKLGIRHIVEEITPILEGTGVYAKRDEAIRDLIPSYAPGWTCKIVLPRNLLEKGGLNVFSVVVESPEGQVISKRLPLKNYLQIVAASNIKQRSRMMTLYYHAEKNNYAVIGTGNKNEHDMGFFVKYGDGAADIKPLVRHFKTQVFQLGAFLGVPRAILERTPTTDTYSAEVSQEDFFFRLDFETLDLIWYALDKGIPADEVSGVMGLPLDQIEKVNADILQKIRTTEYLRANPVEL
jgi:NAD+ synthase